MDNVLFYILKENSINLESVLEPANKSVWLFVWKRISSTVLNWFPTHCFLQTWKKMNHAVMSHQLPLGEKKKKRHPNQTSRAVLQTHTEVNTVNFPKPSTQLEK